MSNTWSKIKSILEVMINFMQVAVAISGDGQVIAVGQDLNSRNLDKGPFIFIDDREMHGSNWLRSRRART